MDPKPKLTLTLKLVSVKPVCSSSSGITLVQKDEFVSFTCVVFEMQNYQRYKVAHNGRLIVVGLTVTF